MVRFLLPVVLVGFLALNALAYLQMRSMMCFAAAGSRTPRPEALHGLRKLRVVLGGVTMPRPQAVYSPAAFGLVAETCRISLGSRDHLAAWSIPSAEASVLVVMFHGYGGEKSSLLEEARLLHEAGAATLLVDFRGSGDSSGACCTMGIRESDDVDAVVRWAEANRAPKTIILYGQSMGGAAAVRAVALRHTRADGLVLESVFDSLLHTVRNRFRAMRLPSWPAAELLVFWGGCRAGSSAFELRPADYTQSVLCPLLVLRGASDPRVSSEEARRVYDSAPGPKRYVAIAGAGHESLASVAPGRWKEEMQSFIRTVGTVPRGTP